MECPTDGKVLKEQNSNRYSSWDIRTGQNMHNPQLQGLLKETRLERFGNWEITGRLGLDCSRTAEHWER
jgi:hypothetical protein